jgi:hypothetical protein
MLSTGTPQSVTDIYFYQPNGAAAGRKLTEVVQDKTALTRGSPASPEPEPRRTTARSRVRHTPSARPKQHGSTKRKTVHLVLWVNPIVKAKLQRVAAKEGLSMSKVGGTLLARSLQQAIDLEYSAILQPVIETAIKNEMQAISTRLAWLLVRVAFDSGQTRALVTNILGRQPGMTEDKLKTILSMSQKAAKGNITRKTPQITALIAAVEQWMVTEET